MFIGFEAILENLYLFPSVLFIIRYCFVLLLEMILYFQGDEISFTTKDVFLYIKSKLPNLDIVTYLFCPERKGNLAKVVFVANDTAKEVIFALF